MSEYGLGDYNCVVRHRAGDFFIICHEIGLIGRGPTLDGAWADCSEKFDQLVEAYRSAGETHSMPPPNAATTSSASQSALPSLGMFALRTLIILVTVSCIIWIGSSIATNAVRHSLETLVSRNADLDSKKIWSKIEREIQKTANRRLSDEKQAELTLNIRKIIQQVKPFTDELAPIFECPAPVDKQQ